MTHDPGGKTRLKLQDGVRGGAIFSECGRFRPYLSRWWGPTLGRHTLWIGMNPSTADGEVDDPTIRREVGFTRRWGYTGYVKTNVCDYRATNPKDLLRLSIEPRSESNLRTILEFATTADKIILAFGRLHPRLKHFGDETVTALRKAGRELWCLGFTSDGSPRHPLYIKSETPLQAYGA